MRRTLFLTVLVVMSCSESSDPPAFVLPCRISKIVTTVSNIGGVQLAKYTQSFTYDSEFFLSKETDLNEIPGFPDVTYDLNYLYIGGEVASITQSTQTATWNHDNGLVKTIVNGTTTSYSFAYDASGQLTAWNGTYNPVTHTVSLIAVYNGENIASAHLTQIFGSSGIDVTYNFSLYDTKNNPYKLLAEATSQTAFHTGIDGGVDYWVLSFNNPASLTYTGSVAPGTTTFTYVYNARQYPTKIIGVQVDPITTTIIVKDFEYTNCN